MLKLLVPVDGSESSLHAVEHVVGLAAGHGPVTVKLLNVYDEPVRYGDVGVKVTPEQMAAIERRQTDPALSTAERLLRESGIGYDRLTRAGDVAATIAKQAADLGCDGIVMGTRGAGSLASLVMGSVATKVVHLASVPVTLVK